MNLIPARNYLLLFFVAVLLLSCGFKAKPQSELLDYRPAIPFRSPPKKKVTRDKEPHHVEKSSLPRSSR